MITSLLIAILWLVFVGVIFYVIWWGLGQIALPEPVKTVIRVLVIVGFVIILVLLLLAMMPPFPGRLSIG